jgi:hypothetical protein
MRHCQVTTTSTTMLNTRAKKALDVVRLFYHIGSLHALDYKLHQ